MITWIVRAAEVAMVPTPWSGECVYDVGNGEKVATLKGFGCLTQNIMSAVWPLLGLAFAVMVIAAGIQFIVAGGEKEGLAKARKTLTYALMGLFLAALSWLILAFFNYLFGFNLTTLKIGS